MTEVEHYLQKTGSQIAQQTLGGLAACLLAGSCVQDIVQDPELGMLLVSGHVDVLSAKVCSLPRGLQENSENTRQAPDLYNDSPVEAPSDDDVVERVSIFDAGTADSDGGSLASSSGDALPSHPPPEKKARISPGITQGKDKSGEMMIEFLRANGSPTADEASCLASGSLDEAPRTGNITPVTRYLAREASAAQSSVTTSEVLGSLEEEGFAVRGRHNVSRRLAMRANLPYLS